MIDKYNNNSISPLQYFAIVIMSSNVLFNGIGLSNILKTSKNDSWISIIIGFIIGLPLILLINYMNNNNLNFFDLINKSFNKILANIINFIFIAFLFFILIITLNDFINFANLKYLFETPNLLISILFILPILYIISKGIETIGRSALIMIFLAAIIHLTNSLALVKYIDIENLNPIIKDGIIPILKSSIYYIICSITPIIFLSSITKNNKNKKKYNKYLIFGYLIGFISIFIDIFYITTIYNYKYITLFNYPAYFTIKKIEYGFISNAENILSLEFIINYFFFILMLIYILFDYLKNILKLNKKAFKYAKNILIILIIILPIISFKSTLIARYINDKYLTIFSLIFMLIYFIIIPLKIKISKKTIE